ncbi:MAG: MotA/TolQ/ExbB proton channel family protein [Candidatus Krumholzibacteria bacterium]|jgi:biopolymer transport protein ExbB|nr:MotA/TolQ/ExbB proton channel family protein [Candidatus Krumholzibacteria bacterium]
MTEFVSELQKGGIVMIPLLLGSVLALAIVIERAFQLRTKKVLTGEIVKAIEKIESVEDIRVAERICEANPGPFAGIILVALRNRDLGADELKEAILDQGRQEIRSLERGLVALETIAVASPLLGLLGTVTGMIKVFNVISKQGIGQASYLSGGISEALITTVTGLVIGIPALVAYNLLTSRAESLVLDMEKYSSGLLRNIRAMKAGASGAGAKPPLGAERGGAGESRSGRADRGGAGAKEAGDAVQ